MIDLTANIIIDARSITHYLYIFSFLKNKIKKENIIIIWTGKKEHLVFLNKLLELPKIIYSLDINTKSTSLIFDLLALKKIKKISSELVKKYPSRQLLTTYASGLYFEFLKKNLNISDKNVIQFDDGSLNLIVKQNKFRIIKKILFYFYGINIVQPKYILFSDERFISIYTSLNPKNIININKKIIINISKNVNDLFSFLSNKHLWIPKLNSAVLLTTHSVESKRMVIADYQNLITRVYKNLKLNGANEIYLSKHPAETSINDSFYLDLGLKLEYSSFPSEFFLINNNINYIANPFNSTIIVGYQMGLLNKINYVLNFTPKKNADAQERFQIINKILLKSRIKSKFITYDD